jgi:starch phosphorylase
MESMATLAIPATGYGIRYDFGLFRQIISNGWQQEYPDEWLSFGNPWEFQRPEVVYHVHFGGGVEHVEKKGRDLAIWHPAETVQALAYDTPIVGWRGHHVNALRLWSARSPDPLKLDVFNTGDYLGASAEEARAESICKFLYPNDESPAGCGRNISLSRPRCRIWSTAISPPTGSCGDWPQRPRCSSTTPIPVSPSPS